MKTNYSTKHLMVILAMLFMGLMPGKSQAQLLSCQAEFTTWVNPGGSVVFYDTSYVNGGQVTQWLWDFGDGMVSTQQYQTIHMYANPGTYLACLTITTSIGCTDTFCATVTVPGNCQMTNVLSVDSVNSNINATVVGGNPPYLYSWTFNGTSLTTSMPTISYNAMGVYCCFVTDANGCTASSCVNVGGGGVSCQAFFNTSMLSPGSFYFNNASTGGVSYTWNFGDGNSSNQASPIHTYATSGTYMVCLNVMDSTGATCDSYCAAVTYTSVGNSVLCGNVFNDLNANGVSDGNDMGLGGQTLTIWGNGMQGSVVTDSNGNYTLNVAPGTYTIYYCAQFPYTITSPPDSFGCAFYYVTIGANDTLCGNNFGVTANTVSISGRIYHDANTNGVFDFGETGIPYQPVTIGSNTVYTNFYGEYSTYEPVGTYTINYTPTGSYAGYALTSPASITVVATTVGNSYPNNDFGLNIPPGSTDLSITLSPSTTITPGFNAWYYVTVHNSGVLPASGVVTFHYPTGLTFDYATPAATSVNTSTQTVTWNVNNIPAFGTKTIWVDFNASTSLVLGTSMLSMVDVTLNVGIEPNLANNMDSVHQIVVGSWDPNNKLVTRTNLPDVNYQMISTVNPDQSIDYTINFQNEGTAPAVNIVVIDALSSNVDFNSFKFLGASHNVSVKRTGNEVNYMFPNIMLVDKTTNEPLSHGFIKYRINAVNGLAAGTQISDNAAIYFDFNAPVITNDAVITIVLPQGINDVNTGNAVQLYPNPVKGVSKVQFELTKASFVNVEVIDVTGRLQATLSNEILPAGLQSLSLDASKMANGIYTIKTNIDGKQSITKFTVAN